jgi:hypothetical protein
MEQPTNPTTISSAHIRTVYLFAALTIVSLALVWANGQFVMTKEVLLAMAGNPHNTFQVDMQYETVQRMSAWGYAMAPLQTACRIGLVALIVQMVCLLGGVEIPYRKIFRISAVAFGATLFGSLLQIFWIARQPTTAISQASLGIVPDSLAAWFNVLNEAPPFVYLMLSRASITSLLWMLLLYWGLCETKRLRATGAAAATAATWVIVSTLHVATSLFVRELVS